MKNKSERNLLRNNTNTFYFAYGSNMNIEQMNFRCPNSRTLGKISILGYQFIINSRGVATIIPRNYSTVNGVLWSINLKNELNLDYYEGIKKKIYFKKYFYIPFLNQKILILVYIAFNQIIGIPKKGYLEKVIDGAKSFKAEKKWINELENWGN